ncbi:MAG: hypothetical protein JWP14_467 [Frankiales bacterium]|nr:hypothetical protein [Frankiales bacterium]
MRRWLAGALLVTVGWLASPTSVPVYDGLPNSDEPYRYVGKSPAPTSASATATVTGGQAGALRVQTGETGPQLLVDLAPGAFQATTAKVTLAATPLAPSGTPPRGTFDSNAYRLTVTPVATLSPDQSGFLFLRAAVMTKPNPVVVFRTGDSAPWKEVPAQLTGRDIMATTFTSVGDYALVRLPGSKPITSGGLGLTRVLFLGGGVLLLVVVTVLVLRRPHDDED